MKSVFPHALVGVLHVRRLVDAFGLHCFRRFHHDLTRERNDKKESQSSIIVKMCRMELSSIFELKKHTQTVKEKGASPAPPFWDSSTYRLIDRHTDRRASYARHSTVHSIQTVRRTRTRRSCPSYHVSIRRIITSKVSSRTVWKSLKVFIALLMLRGTTD